MAYEIERKFLIKKLDVDLLLGLGARVKEIEQSYLIPSEDFPVRRIRRVLEGGKARYYFTLKRPSVGEFTREEIEQEISSNQYLKLQKERDLTLNEIVKTRYVICQNGLCYEIDRFPFFTNFDILEIELPSETTPIQILPEISIIKEVTLDFRFTNQALAKEIPKDF